ncbi:Exosome complex exonuclease RRP4 [Spironucleus salmonicida]|uniref:Exosome complex exonuclease RRP4 n=1 Tax=Spironucleus salmonicida TaxID=348837 RepID=V6LFC1_9EUKA|nr:Exosome complex exonuclease RRP4 [Spironucleus salmonicida]|eukprot:EST42993.1 Exosome complex exonuclease RRP4 [Spironucleus salmonicida]
MKETFRNLQINSIMPGDRLELPTNIIIGENIIQSGEYYFTQQTGVLLNEQKHYTIQHQNNYFYIPDTRDFIIGRVHSLRLGAWSIELGAVQKGSINIDSLHLPGLLRIKNSADESHQRAWLAENEVIAAEVRNIQGIQLNARSEQMGKLSHGYLVCGVSWQVASLRNVYQQDGVRVLVGRNGWIWVSGQTDFSGESNSVIDQRIQDYTDEEMLIVIRCIQRVYYTIHSNLQLTEDIIFEE